MGSDDNKVYALDASTGAQKWSYTTNDAVRFTPTLSHDGATIFVGSDEHMVYALDASTGAKKWSYATDGIFAQSQSSTLSTDGTTIFVGSRDNKVYALTTGVIVCPAGTRTNATGAPASPPFLAYSGVPPASLWSHNGHNGDCGSPDYFGIGAPTNNQYAVCLFEGNAGWVQLDLQRIRTVTGIVTKGRPLPYGDNQRVSKYSIEVSRDGTTYTSALCATVDVDGYCIGNVDTASLVTNTLAQPVTARYVKLYVRAHGSYASLRMGVFISDDCTLCEAGKFSSSPGSASCQDCEAGKWSQAGAGAWFLAYGGVPPASMWSHNGVHDVCNNPDYYGIGSPNAAVVGRAVCLTEQDAGWVQLDLQKIRTVTGVVTQGRWQDNQYVTRYSIEVSHDGSTYTARPILLPLVRRWTQTAIVLATLTTSIMSPTHWRNQSPQDT